MELIEGDAEALPFPDASFDAVTSVFGSMFAPDHARAAAELLRVSPARRHDRAARAGRPTGSSASSSARSRPTCRRRPGCPRRCSGAPRAICASCSATASPRSSSRERTFTWRFASAEEFVAFFRRWYGPTLKAFAALEGDARDALEHDLVALARRHDRLDAGATAIPATYTEAIAITR